MSGKIVIKYNNLPKLAAKLPEAVHEFVSKAAHDVEANAKAVVPVRTGALKNSITTEFTSPTRAVVAPHMDYAAYVEFGTRRQRAKPYMRPAAERVRPAFIEALRRLEERLQ